MTSGNAVRNTLVKSKNPADARCVKDDPSWMAGRWRRIFQNVAGAGAAALDVPRYLRAVRATGADVLTVDARGGQCQYDTQVGQKNPLLGPRDLLRELVEGCRRHDMKFVAYMWNINQDPAIEQQHPDWRMQSFDGTVPTSPNGAALCYNSPWRDTLSAYLREILAYGVDGFFFDSNDHFPTVCYCPTCARLFRARFDATLPVHADWDCLAWRQFLLFREQSILDFLTHQRDTVRAAAAGRDVPIIINWAMSFNDWRCGQDDRPLRLDGVYAMVETHLEPGDLWYAERIGPHWSPVALRTLFLQRLRAGVGGKTIVGWNSHATQLAGQGSQAGSWAPTAPDAERQLRFRTLIANGAIPEIASPRYGTESVTIREIAAREEWLQHTRPHGWAGLLHSTLNRDFCAPSQRRDGPESYREWRLEENAFFLACLEAHLPARILTDVDLETGALDDLAVLVLPDTRCLSDAAAQHVRAFVRRGGGLVATGETGLCDAWGRPRKMPELADVLGVRMAGRTEFRRERTWNDLWGGWSDPHRQRIEFPVGGDLGSGLALRDRRDPWFLAGKALRPPAGYAVSWAGPLPVVRAADGARVCSELEYESSDGARRVRSPAVVRNRFGQGRVVYTAFPLGRLDQKLEDDFVRRFMLNALRASAPRPPEIEGVGPAGVVMVVNDQPRTGRRIVHLLNEVPPDGRAPLIRRPRQGCVPIEGFQLIVRGPRPRHVRRVPDGLTLRRRTAPDGVRITVPPLALHTMIELDMQTGSPP